jgi:TolB-like protein
MNRIIGTNMKIKSVISGALCVFLCAHAFAETDSMDKELAALTEKLVIGIKASGMKKVTVLDFTDLQHNTSEFGRYVAQELTLDLVASTDRKFSVLDRANSKSILAEHNLTATGLVNPANAKKFGQFAGVDAFIFGTIVSIDENVQVSAQLVTTETSVVEGGGKVRFSKSKEVKELLGSALPSVPQQDNSTSGSESQEPVKRDFNSGKSSFTFDGLSVSLDSFRLLRDNEIAAVVTFKSTSTNISVRVGLIADSTGTLPASLIDERGNTYDTHRDDVQGVFVGQRQRTVFQNRDEPNEQFIRAMAHATSIELGGTISANILFSPPNVGRPMKSGSVFKLYCSFKAVVKARDAEETLKEYSFTVEGIKPLLPKPEKD